MDPEIAVPPSREGRGRLRGKRTLRVRTLSRVSSLKLRVFWGSVTEGIERKVRFLGSGKLVNLSVQGLVQAQERRALLLSKSTEQFSV